ncbi:TetR/AcrR family transcriptional regulator [Methylobacterium nodulans]|uniref:Transcriptional regulator, TetR family n=1 Tax=Methylobacterium nodulans (strain LMG 21967 / CNCM I-2342 / ORS 2060) TaxID=460265 RepID=B8IMA4_METNO|nr:TetR/AcrR family transcriptional regulator [Methylobacterium nodulans]ACL58290.1 transcriptional regulator, TetR family [Methylobacterium nodulans ORS 2060]
MARTRAQDYDLKRQTILHKSAELFAQFGYSGTSIAMIAEACGVSKALLYHYYHDKEAVLFDILSSHLEQLIEVVESALETAPEVSRIYAIAAALLEAYRDADAEHQVQLANLKLLPAEKQEVLRGMERRLVTYLSDAIAEAVPEIGRGPLLKPVTMSAFGMINWHYLWFRDGKGLSRADYARLVAELITTGAAGAAEALAAPIPASRMTVPPRPAAAVSRRKTPAPGEV